MEHNTEQRAIDRLDLYAREKNFNDARITRDCGLSIGLLGKCRKPGKDLSYRTMTQILAVYTDLNPDWLTKGRGEMFARDEATPDYPSYPFVDTTMARCGGPDGLSAAITTERLPKISLPGVPRDTSFFIQAAGYSMVNDEHPELSIPPGAIVGVAEPTTDFVRWGEVYVVSTADGIMIKRLLQSDNPEFVTCVSYNAEYPPFRVAKDDIYDCARITCVIPMYVR